MVPERARVVAGARLAWLPQPAIRFGRSAFRRRLAFDLAPDVSVVAVEATILGRYAMGERRVHGRFDEHWRTHRRAPRLGRRPAAAGPRADPRGPGDARRATASAPIVCVEDDPAGTLARLRTLLADAAGRSGASALGPVVVGMLLADGPRRLTEDLPARDRGGARAPDPPRLDLLSRAGGTHA